jgi:DNA-binding transcriptional ArsR family regulator
MAESRPPLDRAARAAAEHARDRYFATRLSSQAGQPLDSPNPQESAENHSTIRLTIAAEPLKLNHMVERQLDSTFHALADPTRRGMLATLAAGEKSIGELAEPFAMSFAGAAKHVKVLEGAGLVSRRKAGRTQLCRLNPGPLAEAQQWLRQWEQFWTVRLDALEALIQEDHRK